MSFGFSVGDFITVLELVATAIDALRATGNAASQYRVLLKQLDSLQTALLAVHTLEIDETLFSFQIALRQAASQCLDTMLNFWKKLLKYQTHLGTSRSGFSLKDGLMKIKWAVHHADDITKFQIDLMGHTQAIQILVGVINQASLRIQHKKLKEQNQNLIRFSAQIQQAHYTHMQSLATISGQNEEILERTNQIISKDIRVCQMMLQYQDIVSRIPGQIDRQQPVFIIDSLNRQISFSLDNIQSLEAFKAMLKANFQHIGNACRKIDRGSFFIRDNLSRQEVDFTADWSKAFRPGQQVSMLMVAWSVMEPVPCPDCEALCKSATYNSLHCDICGLNFSVNDSDDFLHNLSDVPGQTSYQPNQKPLSFREELQLYQRLLMKPIPPRSGKGREICSQNASKIQPWQYVLRRKGYISENKD